MAQTGSIRGFVYQKDSGEPEPFVNVFLDGGKYGASTDVNGYFLISKVPLGKYTLGIKSVGYDDISETIEITKPNQLINKKYFLVSGVVNIDVFEVSGQKSEAQTQVKVSEISATPTIIGYVPTVGGQADLATYLQTLPGVVFTGDQGGQLYIRGGSPIQNKVLLDGMIIYNPFHSIGFFSVFDTDIIRNADIYTGGFNAEYGGRISSIMDITTRDGNKKEISGNFGLSPFMARGILEGPLIKDKGNGATASFLLSGKASFLEQTSKVLYTGIDGIDSTGLPFNFADFYGKVSFNGSNGSKFNMFGFNFTDQVKFRAIEDLGWNSFGVGSNFVLVPASTPVLVEGNFSYSEYDITIEEQAADATLEDRPRSSKISGFNFGLDFKYFVRENEIKYGIEVVGYNTDFNFFNSIGRRIEQQESTTELGGYLTYKITAGLLLIEPSFRIQRYTSFPATSLEPRLGMKLNVNEKFRLKAAAGRYSQNLMAANSDRDVVNLFFGFLAGPSNLQDNFIQEDGTSIEVRNGLQTAVHGIFGAEYDVSEKFNINVEGFIKRFTQVTNVNRNKIFDDTPENADRPDVLKKDFIVENGDAVGIDFVFKYQNKQTYLWAVYSLAKVFRWDGIREYAPIFDRRHNVNIVASYKFGKGKELPNGKREENVYDFTARWNLGSGFPFTQTQGYFQEQNFADGINTDVTQNNGDLGLILAELNQGRLPIYHRLDLNISRTYDLTRNKKVDEDGNPVKGKAQSLEVNVGVTNAYNRDNIFFVDRVTQERVDQLPILPSVGFKYSF